MQKIDVTDDALGDNSNPPALPAPVTSAPVTSAPVVENSNKTRIIGGIVVAIIIAAVVFTTR